MLNLVKKDLLIQGRSIKFLLIFLPVFTCFLSLKDLPYYSYSTVIGVVTFIIGGFSFEEKSSNSHLPLSMPVTRNMVVLSKYYEALIFFFPIAVLNLIIGFILSVLGLGEMPQWFEVVYAFVLNMVICGIIIPFGLTFKSYVYRFVLFILFFGLFALLGYLDNTNLTDFISTNFIYSQPVLSAAVAGSVLFMLLSGLVSCFLYKIKDF